MARRTHKPADVETATDVNAETAETAGTAARPAYRVLRGISYPAGDGEQNAEPGDEVDDIPDRNAAALLAAGAIERI